MSMLTVRERVSGRLMWQARRCAGFSIAGLIGALAIVGAARAETPACTLADLAAGVATCSCPDGARREGPVCAAVPDPRFKGPRRHVLLRVARLQFCARELGHYEGPVTGKMTTPTLRALGKIRVAAKLRYPRDASKDGPLHAEVWRLCRVVWASRIALAKKSAPAAPLVTPRIDPPVQPAPQIGIPAPQPTMRPKDGLPGAAICLPKELAELIAGNASGRAAVPVCELPCIARPVSLSGEDARALERRHGVRWCGTCVTIATPLPVEEALRIESAGNITLCPRSLPRPIEILSSGRIVQDALQGVRAAFGRADQRPATRHDHVALVVTVARSALSGGGKPIAERDGAAMKALLLERLGYRGDQVLHLANPTRADLYRALAPGAENPIGRRLGAVGGANLFVYVSARGLSEDEGESPLILLADAVAGRETQGAIAVDAFVQALARLTPSGLTVVLEVPFLGRAAGALVPPNASMTGTSALPPPVRGLVVMTSSERDQHALEDVQLRLSLFTRHLVEAMAGAADAAPIGNGDRVIDTAEAFVLASFRTQLAARKTWGLLQRPVLSRGPALPLVHLPP
ncbi:MAG TPA: hypothetical protein PK264_14090 [Hyphomicrobiaceae bacterium]|nr:hypothetical protein [Hyphomicrobiaceae bacterium]